MFEQVADFVGVGLRLGFFGQHQGAGEHGLAQLGQKGEGDLVVWHAQADGFAFGVQRAVGHFFGGGQDKGVGARGGGFELAELAVVHFGVSAQFAQIGAHQGEVVFQIDLADGEDAFHGFLIAHLAAERVAGVGGIHDHAALAHDFGGLFHQPLLGIFGVDGEELCHGSLLRGKTGILSLYAAPCPELN